MDPLGFPSVMGVVSDDLIFSSVHEVSELFMSRKVEKDEEEPE
jgi:hypothetical protein